MQGVNAISDTRPFADNSIAAQEKAPDKRALQQENASTPSLSGKGKLYDRGHEQLELLKAYQSVCQGGTTNFVLISGKAGSGKSSLALSLKNTVLSEGGYFIKGKFDLNVRSGEPYAAIAAAFAEFTNQVISHGEASVAAMREAINKAIAAEGNILINTIPALKSLLGDQRQATSAQGSEAISRFIFVFRFFLRAISSPSKPLVLLIDDWHWADQCSLDLLASLIPDKENSGVLFVGTCRDDVDSKSALSNMLRSLEKKNVAITNISATNLNKEALVHMLSDFLLVPVKDVLPFADLVHEHTSGNSLYVIEFLRLLKEKNVLSYDCQKHRWEWSDGVSLMMAQGSGVDDLIVAKLRALPAEVQEVLRVASFMGATTNRVFLTYVISSSMDDYLNAAIDCGFLLFDQQQNIITFQHDCIQEAAYALTPEDGRVAKHLAIGRKLWRSMSDGELEGNVFVVLNQLHRGFDLISSQKERYAVASLCLVAAEKAARASTFRRSAVHLELGIVLLGPKTWRDQYALTLAIHNAAAEVCYCTGEFDRVDQYVNAIFQNGRTFSDKLRAHATHVYALGARSKMGEALDAGLEVLKRLGESFPAQPRKIHVVRAAIYTRNALKGKSDEMIMRLPTMQDEHGKLSAMQMLNLILLYAYLLRPNLAALVTMRMIHLSIKYGISALSSIGFCSYGILLCSFAGKIDDGYRFGKLALQIIDKFQAIEYVPRVYAAVYGFIFKWKLPERKMLEPLHHASRVGCETGDIEYGLINAALAGYATFHCGFKLSVVDKEVTSFLILMDSRNQEGAAMMLRPFLQLIHNLMARNSNPAVLSGDIIVEESIRKLVLESRDLIMRVWVHYDFMLLAYLFGDYDRAWEEGTFTRIVRHFPMTDPDIANVVFMECLSSLALCRHPLSSKRRHLSNARGCIKFVKRLAVLSPHNCLGKLHLMQAELASTTGNDSRALTKFMCAIALFADSGTLMYSALANELAGRHFIRLGNQYEAAEYLQRALSSWCCWEADAKVLHFRKEFPSIVLLEHEL